LVIKTNTRYYKKPRLLFWQNGCQIKIIYRCTWNYLFKYIIWVYCISE
jgi:hypothetical protein